MALEKPLPSLNHCIQMRRTRASLSDTKNRGLVVEDQTNVSSLRRTNLEETKADGQQFQDIDVERPEKKRP